MENLDNDNNQSNESIKNKISEPSLKSNKNDSPRGVASVKIPKEFAKNNTSSNQKIKIENKSKDELKHPSQDILSWESLFEEFRYEQSLFSKDIKELSASASFVSKGLIKKFTTLVSKNIREKAEGYPGIIREAIDSICDIEKHFLKEIKHPNE